MFRPTIMLEDIVPVDATISSYVPEEAGRWLPRGEGARARLSAGLIQFAGTNPLLVHGSVVNPSVLPLLGALLPSFPTRFSTISDDSDFARHIADIRRKGALYYSDYLLPPGWLPDSCLVHPASLVASLNNKDCLEEWVPRGLYPERVRKTLAEWKLQEPIPFPYVVKAVTDCASGGGVDVMVCRNEEDKAKAIDYFSGEEKVLLEEWIPAARLFCVQGAILKDGSYTALGSSEQVCDEKGRPLGNWIDSGTDVGPEGQTLAATIIRKAGAAGYRGFAGLDILRKEDGTLKVIDLNFRSCYSTKGLLLQEQLKTKWNWDCMAMRSWNGLGDPSGIITRLKAGMTDCRIFPWALQLFGDEVRALFLAGGSSREDVDNCCRLLLKDL